MTLKSKIYIYTLPRTLNFDNCPTYNKNIYTLLNLIIMRPDISIIFKLINTHTYDDTWERNLNLKNFLSVTASLTYI